MAWNGTVLSFTYVPQNVAKSMTNFIGQPCSGFQLAVCLAKQDGAIWRSVMEIFSDKNFARRQIL